MEGVKNNTIPQEESLQTALWLQTGCLMKCLERLIRKSLLLYIQPTMGKYQFAYQSGRSPTDACTLLQQPVVDHIDEPKTYARMLFMDYSSVFNTIIPSRLINCLTSLGVEENLLKLVIEFLLNRTQRVMVEKSISEVQVTNTGAPQGCVLFTVYTLIVFVLWISVPRYLSMQMTLQCLDWSQMVMSWVTVNRLRTLHLGVKRIIFCWTPQRPRKW